MVSPPRALADLRGDAKGSGAFVRIPFIRGTAINVLEVYRAGTVVPLRYGRPTGFYWGVGYENSADSGFGVVRCVADCDVGLRYGSQYRAKKGVADRDRRGRWGRWRDLDRRVDRWRCGPD